MLPERGDILNRSVFCVHATASMLSVQDTGIRDFILYLETFLTAVKAFSNPHENTKIHLSYYTLGSLVNREDGGCLTQSIECFNADKRLHVSHIPLLFSFDEKWFGTELFAHDFIRKKK